MIEAGHQNPKTPPDSFYPVHRTQQLINFENDQSLRQSVSIKELFETFELEDIVNLAGEPPFQPRDYQIEFWNYFFSTSSDVILTAPTNSGKTCIALISAALCFKQQGWSVLFMTTQRELCDQIAAEASRFLCLSKDEIAVVHGEFIPSERQKIYSDPSIKLIIATSHVINNDFIKEGSSDNRATLECSLPDSIKLLIVDETHHAQGDDSSARILRSTKSKGAKIRRLAMSATPAEDSDSKTGDKLLDLIQLFPNPDLVKLRLESKPKDSRRIRVNLSGELIDYQYDFYRITELITKYLQEQLEQFPDFRQTAAKLVTLDRRGKMRAKSNLQIRKFRSQLKSSLPRGQYLDDIVNHLHALETTLRYCTYLTVVGKAFFLDRMGRSLVAAKMVYTSNLPDPLPHQFDQGMFVEPKRDGKWFHLICRSNPRIMLIQRKLEELYLKIADRSPYALVVPYMRHRYSIDKLGWDMCQVDPLNYLATPPIYDIDGHKIAGARKSRNRCGNGKGSVGRDQLRDIFRAAIIKTASSYWDDHPATETILSLISDELARDRMAKILVVTEFFEEAVFLSAKITECFSERNLTCQCIGGAKHMKQRDRARILKAFSCGETQVLVSTVYIGEGHNIPQVAALINHYQTVRAVTRIQLHGRPGRTGEARIYEITTENTKSELSYLACNNRVAKFQKLLSRFHFPVISQNNKRNSRNSPPKNQPTRRQSTLF